MRTFLVTVVAFALIGWVAASGPVPSNCVRCICQVESGCRDLYPTCRMDVGSLSCGSYQIKKPYFIDATLYDKGLGDWQTCTASKSCSERVVQAYMKRYATSRRLGHNPTCEDFARIHNGGPNGYKYSSTDKYWSKVKQCL